MSFVDGHCHLSDPRFGDAELPAVLERSRTAGVGAWVLGGVGPEDWLRQRELARKHGPGLHCSFGLHPWWLRGRSAEEVEAALGELPGALDEGEAVALGETGLDFGPRAEGIDRELQLSVCRRQLRLAAQAGKPLVIHCVHAHAELLRLLEESGQGWRGIVHSYSGGPEEAARYLKAGLSLSFSGSVTRRGFTSVKKAVKLAPPEALVVETDSPDQPPEGWSGRLNEPASLIRIAQAIGALRDEKAEAVLERSARNLGRIFGI